jgi:hypothetical protein
MGVLLCGTLGSLRSHGGVKALMLNVETPQSKSTTTDKPIFVSFF